MTEPVIIAGGGIGGLATSTDPATRICRVPCVDEAVKREIAPLRVPSPLLVKRSIVALNAPAQFVDID